MWVRDYRGALVNLDFASKVFVNYYKDGGQGVRAVGEERGSFTAIYDLIQHTETVEEAQEYLEKVYLAMAEGRKCL